LSEKLNFSQQRYIEIILLRAKVVILYDFDENLSFFELALSCQYARFCNYSCMLWLSNLIQGAFNLEYIADSKIRKNGKKAEPNDPAPAYGYLGKSYAPFSILHPWHVPGIAV
jgi:hypothetical protein